MNDLDILERRREAHRAACADLENDILLQAVFGTPAPIAPIASPLQVGAMLKRQAA